MNSDIFIAKGSDHLICEDYGLVTNTNLIIADGCSTAKYSDVSSRILSHICKNELSKVYVPSYNDFGLNILKQSKEIIKYMGINDLISTLAFSFIFNDKIYIYVYGDVILAIKKNNNEVEKIKINFKNNTPYYLWYMDKPEFYTYSLESTKVLLINNDLHEYNKPIIFEYNLAEIELIGLFTDGISTFIKTRKKESKFGNIFTEDDFINHVFNIQSMNGNFVQRTVKRLLKELQNDFFIHNDDITCAMMYNDKNDII